MFRTPRTVAVTWPTMLASNQLDVEAQNLSYVFETQNDRYMTIKAYDALGFGEVEYGKMLEEVAQAFVEEERWSLDQAKKGLTQIAMFDSRLSGEFLAMVSETSCQASPDECANFESIVTPKGIYIAQFQAGEMHFSIKPCNFRAKCSYLEVPMTVREGLNIVALGGPGFLALPGSVLRYKAILSGSVTPMGNVPYLRFSHNNKLCLSVVTDIHVLPDYGLASRGILIE